MTKKSDFYLVYVTTADAEEAHRIGDELVERRLVACVNIIPRISSIYRWKGKIQRDEETIVLLKTTGRHLDEVIKAVRALSSYEVPDISCFAIDAGDSDFLSWIETEVGDDRG